MNIIQFEDKLDAIRKDIVQLAAQTHYNRDFLSDDSISKLEDLYDASLQAFIYVKADIQRTLIHMVESDTVRNIQ